MFHVEHLPPLNPLKGGWGWEVARSAGGVKGLMKFLGVIVMKKMLIFMLVLSCIGFMGCKKDKLLEKETSPETTKTETVSETNSGTETETFSETEETVPDFTPQPWVNYSSIREENLPELQHIQNGTKFYEIVTIVGSIEQRFFEVERFSEKDVSLVAQVWENFSGNALEEKNLFCIMPDKKMNFSSIPEENYAEVENLVYEDEETILQCDILSQDLEIKSKDFPENPVSVYQQAISPSVYAVKTERTENGKFFQTLYQKEDFVYDSDFVMLDGEKVSIQEIFLTMWEQFQYFGKEYSFNDPEIRIEIQNFSDGNQAVILDVPLISRDIPVLAFGESPDGVKQITGTTAKIGFFRKGEIGFLQIGYLSGQPTQKQITDFRPNQNPQVLLIDQQEAFRLADETLTENRNLLSGSLVYATEKLYSPEKIFLGYVLTPVYEFVFETNETERQQGHVQFGIGIDAVTKEIFTWYDDQPEHSGEKCWIREE